ncbi:AbiV family abortive infection protein [Sulfoacidibacillus ferrooxidans]|uniref:AbiV family abortive infection protein n=1 Tax=Sulfoacidibacillus ferrooxidans TaxID=2005001 RepID=A0A9X2AFI6_9BACL|nr:AbiV family abortive infection protein [Sulfoacidibacillus ferrooxidans]MCI0184482.1 hypothetical protein [Sulfoacidibacillus ferrooxidans]
MKKQTLSPQDAYELIPLAVENAMEFISAGELLAKNRLYSKAFIMASFAVEELGKVDQLQAISVGGNADVYSHDHKNKAFSLREFIAFMTVKYNDVFSPLMECMNNNLTAGELLDLLSEFKNQHPEIEAEVQKFMTASDIDNLHSRWIKMRFKLLYTNPGEKDGIYEKWENAKEEFEMARIVEDGSVFEYLRIFVEGVKASNPAMNNISFSLFREITDPMLNEFKRTLADG